MTTRVEKPASRIYRDPQRLMRDFLDLRMISVPLTVWRVALQHEDPAQHHYAYLFEFGNAEYWLFDEATDFSGTGGRFFAEMEEFLTALKDVKRPTFQVKEVTMPFEAYWALFNGLYKIWSKEDSKPSVPMYPSAAGTFE